MNTSDVNSQIFEDCLTLLEQGEALDEILQRYPQQAAELRPMLAAAGQLHQEFTAIPVPAAAQNLSRAKFMKAASIAQADQRNSKAKWLFWLPWISFRQVRLSPYMRATVTLVLIFSFIGVFGAVRVSARAIPGDVLYPVKRAAEQTQLLLAQGPDQKLRLEKSFDAERLNEIQILTSQSKSMTEIDFGGPVESIGSAWKINGLVIKTDSQTKIDANIAVGDYANVHGTLFADGAVQASEIKSHKLEINGVISKIAADRWTLDEVEIQINSRTQISGEPKIGSQALAEAVLLGDGKWLALEITLGRSGFEENLEPSETAEHTNTKASPTKTPEPRETEASKTPEPTETRRSTETHESTKTQEPTRTPEPSKTHEPEATKTQRPTETARPTEEPKPTRTPKPTDSDHTTDLAVDREADRGSTKTPTPTPSGDNDKSPTPTKTPKPDDDD